MTEPASATLPGAPARTPLGSHALAGPLMVLAGGVCIGFAPIGLRLGLDELGPQAIALWRYLFAAPVLFALVLFTGKRLPPRPNLFIILAGTCFALDIALWHTALTYTSVSNATFLVNLGNVAVGIAAWLVLRERPTAIWFIAALVALAGAAALSLGGAARAPSAIGGDLLALSAAAFVAGYMLFSKLARRTLSGLHAIFWLTVVEAVVAAALMLATGQDFLPETLKGFAAPLGLALFVQVGGQGLIITGLGRTPAALAGVLVLIQPVVAAAVSWRLFHEPLTALQAAGGAAILVAVWLAQQKQKAPAEAPV
ncbi:DMT family transporter [Hyphomonas sp.]|uniref:DMT family transporter n=1 Tax=Hyphomonas sp. TaxID=87 RepID=UPI00391C7EFC